MPPKTLKERIEILEEKIDLLILLTIGGDKFNECVNGAETESLDMRLERITEKHEAIVDCFKLTEKTGTRYEKTQDVRVAGYMRDYEPSED